MFARTVCINLDRRPDRWSAFQRQVRADWPFTSVERVAAIDGSQVVMPSWYGGAWKPRLIGAWGCFQSHLTVWQACVQRADESVLVFEDDAIFLPDFAELVKTFLAAVPDDWDQVYLGGEHLRPPQRVNAEVLRGRSVNRTHAYAIRRRMAEVLTAYYAKPWTGNSMQQWHVDHQLNNWHRSGKWNIYAPSQWFVGQAAGPSNVWRRHVQPMWWRTFAIEEPAAC